MSQAYSTGAQLGPAYAGLAVGYQLVGPTGTVVAAWTASGVAETTIPGNFTVNGGVSLPASFIGSILWGLSGQTPAAEERVTGTPAASANPYPASASLGPAYAGLAVGYRLFTLAGAASGSFVSAGVTEAAVPGDYSVPAGVALPAGFQGRIVWGTSGSDLAEEWLGVGAAPVAATADPATLATVYCTDEDLAVRCGGDFPQLAPAWQLTCQGSDGVFTYYDRWTLTSALTDFAAQGLARGHVVVLTLRGTFSASGDQFAVEAVAGHSVTLRRLGKPAGAGQPPAPSAGLTGVSFSCPTLDPQSEDASYEVNGLEGVDPALQGRTPADLYDPRSLRQFAVLTVLKRQYTANSRGTTTDFALKAKAAADELLALRSRLVVKWGDLGAARNPTTFLSGRTMR